MKKLVTTALVLLLLLAPALQLPTKAQAESENQTYFIRSTMTYSNPIGNSKSWIYTEGDLTISRFMDNAWQTVELLNSTFPFTTKTDEEGNPVAVLQFPTSTLHPGANITFTVWYYVVSKPRVIPSVTEVEAGNLSSIPPDLVAEYTLEEGPWQTSNPTLKQLALSLKGSETNALTIVKNFIEWIKNNIAYPSGRHENPYYPSQTYAFRQGDCDDQAILLITLSRIVGIPAHLQIGCIYMPQRYEKASVWNDHITIEEQGIGWHGWAVVYVPPWGWLPVDLTYVPAGWADPLNAIMFGAVTSQETIQYMNITHADYVAMSLESRTFLTDNGFRVYVYDEMMEAPEQEPSAGTATEAWVPLVFTTVAVAVFVGLFLLIRQWALKRTRTDSDLHG